MHSIKTTIRFWKRKNGKISEL
uniref:Uncharacterized protein n=1 Tax=Timema poppense TaxID=170557 RepID=A0A7R9DVG3_TIMPO|nr:unnamed protein product [Timema poppensis]